VMVVARVRRKVVLPASASPKRRDFTVPSHRCRAGEELEDRLEGVTMGAAA